jgi:hypothetical protein
VKIRATLAVCGSCARSGGERRPRRDTFLLTAPVGLLIGATGKKPLPYLSRADSHTGENEREGVILGIFEKQQSLAIDQ